MRFTTTDLIASIKRRASIPTSQNLFQNADFLALANDAMSVVLIPLILSVREEYFVASLDHTITQDKFSYAIPTRAIGGKLRDVQLVSSSGDVQSLPRLWEEDRQSTLSTDSKFGFYLVGNTVEITKGTAVVGSTLRLVHYRRPSTLVPVSECAEVVSVDYALNQVTVSSLPSNFGTGIATDFGKGTSGYEPLAIDQTIVSVSGLTITYSSLPTGLAAGDWVSLAGKACVPQIPQELHTVLAQDVAVKCLESMGDPKLGSAQQNLQMMQAAALQTISPRVDGENKKIINRSGLLGSFISRRGGF